MLQEEGKERLITEWMKKAGLSVALQDATAVAIVMDSTAIVARAEQIHKTSAVITAALGRALTAASMMGIMLKGKDHSITIKINGGGPAGTIMAVSDSMGNPRGYAVNPVVELPRRVTASLMWVRLSGKTV